ncbi:hypothetical protein KTO58_14190 [Chitinophaga pendula]|uniref:lycopene cyclase family protein n=1 Tax=Chitinophaga TaxID=79328 RepID=UPI000BAE88CF|nr:MULTISPECIES: lycopene cyclase family protein [Chitinophaga]ASZ12110.1 hypothetical protein CK934_14645 [Chitinophaga sp. MD30]UCJ04854.1 hypothetical protein KTO58_14190 [Chitinophaga pendula]
MNYKEKKHFEIIIVGAGLSGIMLIWEILNRKELRDKKILLLDKYQKEQAPRTWCFWEKGPSSFDDIITKQWRIAELFAGSSHLTTDMYPYSYQMLSSERFFNRAFSIINRYSNITFKQAAVEEVIDNESKVTVVTPDDVFSADMVFDSRLPQSTIDNYDGPLLYQQFAGRFVKSQKPVFNATNIRLMDFRMMQDKKVAFCYLLPFSSTEALLEYTIFTDQIYPPTVLEKGVDDYVLEHFDDTTMVTTSKEYGVIPMGNFPSGEKNKRIIPIGTAGGCSKASSGYTFSFVRLHTLHIIDSLIANELPTSYSFFIPRRFSFYDSVLLRVLKKHPEKGQQIFFQLFKKNSIEVVIRFLHNRSTIREEISIFLNLPVLPFLKAAFAEFFFRCKLF